ncbi:MAG: RagB/SusD family nutrient uptake outer membrane protein, partial [Bacteroidota bacterium]
YDQELVIDYFTNELENKVKAVGVNHYVDNNDISWEVTVWNDYAKNTLLGLMYLTNGALDKAVSYFEKIIYNSTESDRYQLTSAFALSSWKDMFNSIDVREHIYTIWFNKGFYQQNDLQSIFDSREPHQYMLKPTRQAVLNWETIWDDYQLNVSTSNPKRTRTADIGTPGDFHRGYGVSYAYIRNGEPVPEEDIEEMLFYKSQLDFRSASLLVENADTVVWKYSWNKNVFDQDADFVVYRAAGVHLWLAEAYVYWATERSGIIRPFTSNAVNILNDGTNYSLSANREQMGVRGRVGFGGTNDGVDIYNINYIRHPLTNKVIGWHDYTGKFNKKQELLEDYIMEERARELAFEGGRFYDLMRIAKRRDDPSYLAEKVSQKFPAGKREQIYNLLLNEENWYINYFD